VFIIGYKLVYKDLKDFLQNRNLEDVHIFYAVKPCPDAQIWGQSAAFPKLPN